MAKKHRKPESSQCPQVRSNESLTPLGKKLMIGGGVLLLLGFFLLSKTDPYGRNWASHATPFLILGAYGLILVGIILPERSSTQPHS